VRLVQRVVDFGNSPGVTGAGSPFTRAGGAT
jgi:hypothetical protein